MNVKNKVGELQLSVDKLKTEIEVLRKELDVEFDKNQALNILLRTKEELLNSELAKINVLTEYIEKEI